VGSGEGKGKGTGKGTRPPIEYGVFGRGGGGGGGGSSSVDSDQCYDATVVVGTLGKVGVTVGPLVPISLSGLVD
jgi:hypothetical protein